MTVFTNVTLLKCDFLSKLMLTAQNLNTEDAFELIALRLANRGAVSEVKFLANAAVLVRFGTDMPGAITLIVSSLLTSSLINIFSYNLFYPLIHLPPWRLASFIYHHMQSLSLSLLFSYDLFSPLIHTPLVASLLLPPYVISLIASSLLL